MLGQPQFGPAVDELEARQHMLCPRRCALSTPWRSLAKAVLAVLAPAAPAPQLVVLRGGCAPSGAGPGGCWHATRHCAKRSRFRISSECGRKCAGFARPHTRSCDPHRLAAQRGEVDAPLETVGQPAGRMMRIAYAFQRQVNCILRVSLQTQRLRQALHRVRCQG